MQTKTYYDNLSPMFTDRALQLAFLLSLLTHAIILLQGSGISILLKNRVPDKIEVSYVKIPAKKIALPQQKALSSKNEPFLRLPQKITAAKIPPPFSDNERPLKKTGNAALSSPSLLKPSLSKPDAFASARKKISLPQTQDAAKINNASYISYYQIVREKIRRTAYQNYTRTETGEAYLSFIVASDGSLRDERLVDEKSTPNQYLKNIALRSIKEASPFPAFPKELDYPQLSFNVIISFEIE